MDAKKYVIVITISGPHGVARALWVGRLYKNLMVLPGALRFAGLLGWGFRACPRRNHRETWGAPPYAIFVGWDFPNTAPRHHSQNNDIGGPYSAGAMLRTNPIAVRTGTSRDW